MGSKDAGRQAIVQVRWGPMAFRKAILKPGQVLQVGRAEEMGLSLPHDTMMSAAHFELTWNGATCRIRDLKSTGTLLEGKPIKESLAAHGSWIRAGTTDFTVFFEEFSQPIPIEGPGPLLDSHGKREALNILSAQQGLYAVLDSAKSGRILELLQESIEGHQSLYEGPQGAALAEVAPYIVPLPPNTKLLDVLLQEGWGESWGIYLTCPLSAAETRRHLRKLLMVEAEGQEGRLYFRFYDPRVLHQFLPTCTPGQREEFFGHIGCFFYEVEGALLRAPFKVGG